MFDRVSCVVLLCSLVMGGCAMTQAAVDGHELIDQELVILQESIEGYHLDQLDSYRVIQARLASALAEDLAMSTGDSRATEAHIQAFEMACDKLSDVEAREWERYAHLMQSLSLVRDVNDELRAYARQQLQWQGDAETWLESSLGEANDE